MSVGGWIAFAILMGVAFAALLLIALDSAQQRATMKHRGEGRVEAALSRNHNNNDVHSVNGKEQP